MFPFEIGIHIPDHYIEDGAWLVGYAVGGSVLGGVLFNMITRSFLLRALGSRLGMMAGVGYWLIYHTGYLSEREAIRLWNQIGQPALETLLSTLGGALG